MFTLMLSFWLHETQHKRWNTPLNSIILANHVSTLYKSFLTWCYCLNSLFSFLGFTWSSRKNDQKFTIKKKRMYPKMWHKQLLSQKADTNQRQNYDSAILIDPLLSRCVAAELQRRYHSRSLIGKGNVRQKCFTKVINLALLGQPVEISCVEGIMIDIKSLWYKSLQS